MRRYIAYFDILGYKEFIFNNNVDHVRFRAEHILRDIEVALSLEKFQEPKGSRIYADISNSNIHCLNISDTIIFWSNDDSMESLTELLNVAYIFNYTMLQYNMPVRGIACHSEFEIIYGQKRNLMNSLYSANLIYGKGLAEAHLNTEDLNWAGSVIDSSVIEKLQEVSIDPAVFLADFAKLYLVPRKTKIQKEEYAFKLVTGTLNIESFINTKEMIMQSFEIDNKSTSSPRVQTIISNTIQFLESFKE